MTLMEIIQARRSIRRYSDTPVPQKDLLAVLEAGRLAPSAKNLQKWNFTVVEDKAVRQQMIEACKGQRFVAQAPLCLVVWGQNPYVMSCGQAAVAIDCSIALSFMMLRATELGLGTCWLGAFYAEEVKKLLQLPQDATVVAVTPLGYPDEKPAPRPRKELDIIADIRLPGGEQDFQQSEQEFARPGF